MTNQKPNRNNDHNEIDPRERPYNPNQDPKRDDPNSPRKNPNPPMRDPEIEPRPKKNNDY